jgi:thiamine kinase-like enzyme
MTAFDPRTIEATVRQVPAWAHASLDIRPLHGGITNRNFVVTAHGQEYVVRIPGERTELLGIDRANEAEAAQRAAELGIGPPVFGVLPGVHTLVTELVPGHHEPPDRFVERLADIVALVRQFHLSGPVRGAFPIHRVVEWHARDAGAHGVIAPSSYERLHQVSRRIERAFAASALPAVPCHNDLLPANVLFGEGGRLWLLDFEYAGMNDLFFDLGNLSVNADLPPAVDEQLLTSYFGTITRSAWARLQLMKVMSEFREGMWAVVQQAISTLDTDFVTYAAERLGNCERLAGSSQFEGWLDDAARPPLPPGIELAG